MRAALILFAGLLAAPDQQATKTFADGQEARICGVIQSYQSGAPRKCDTRLRVLVAGEMLEVLIPASIRADLTPAPERLLEGEACFSGRIARTGNWVTLNVESAAGVQVNKEGSPFGAGAALLCDGDIRPPRVLAEKHPSYTSTAMRERAQGVVELEAVVDIDGSVSDARVVRPLHTELDESALYAVKQWKFAPGIQNAKPVAVIVNIEMTFTLAPRRW